MKRNSYVHCSFDLVESFKPRVPKTRVIGKFVSEEAETPRICTADTIQHALLGIPGCADVMQNIQKFDMRIYIHVYYLTSEDIKFPTEEEVPDVKETHEVWILSEPQKIIRQDYEITDFKTSYHKDLNGIKHQILAIFFIAFGEKKEQEPFEEFSMWKVLNALSTNRPEQIKELLQPQLQQQSDIDDQLNSICRFVSGIPKKKEIKSKSESRKYYNMNGNLEKEIIEFNVNFKTRANNPYQMKIKWCEYSPKKPDDKHL